MTLFKYKFLLCSFRTEAVEIFTDVFVGFTGPAGWVITSYVGTPKLKLSKNEKQTFGY